MGSAEILVSGGVAGVLAGVAGGGLKAFGVELPLLATVKRQLLAVGVGITLIGLGLVSDAGVLGTKPVVEGGGARNEMAGATTNNAVEAASPDKPVESPQPQGPPGAPDMLGMGFPEARRLIVAAGWAPIWQEAAPRDNPALGLRGEEVEASGYREAVSCAATGSAPCLLRYRQSGHVLEVVVLGNTLESGVIDMYDVLGCNARQRPEGCLAE